MTETRKYNPAEARKRAGELLKVGIAQYGAGEFAKIVETFSDAETVKRKLGIEIELGESIFVNIKRGGAVDLQHQMPLIYGKWREEAPSQNSKYYKIITPGMAFNYDGNPIITPAHFVEDQALLYLRSLYRIANHQPNSEITQDDIAREMLDREICPSPGYCSYSLEAQAYFRENQLKSPSIGSFYQVGFKEAEELRTQHFAAASS
jgi:hypothetical protein